MAETNKTTGGLNRITRVAWPLAALVLASGLGVLAVVFLELSASCQLRSLDNQIQSFRSDAFQLGASLKNELTQLNAAILRFELSNDSSERDAFHARAANFKAQIARTMPVLYTPEERTLADRIRQLYNTYLAQVTPLLEKGLVGVRRDSAQKFQEELDRLSADLLHAISQLTTAQQQSRDALVTSTLQRTASVQRSMILSGLLLVILVAAIAASLHLAMVTPLRAKLSETEAAIERQASLASLGTLATGVAHEIPNPLAAIKFRLFSLKKSLPAAHMDNEDVQVINSEINRLERLVKDFLEFARPTEPQLVNIPADRVLNEVRDLLAPQAQKSNIQLNVESAEGIWLNADRQQLQQVLINLVQNAAESIGRDGAVTLRARQGVSKINRQSQPVVTLEVSDTGKGIPPDVEDRIFDPFFSTREGGTGLGLSIAARIVELHGGYIQYQTERNRGTTFSIVLPRPANNDGTNSNS
jgi:signal transduction histidine kinase